MGEAIKTALYGDVPVSQLSEEQKQTLVALGTVVAGLAGGLAGNSTADAMAGAQAGQNEISNNMFGVSGMLSQMLAQETLNSAAMAEAGKGGANEQAALALTKAVKEGLGAACLENDACVLMAVVAAQQYTNGAGSKTETVPVNDDLTGGKLVSPGQDESKGTSLITPDRSGEQGASNTGNRDGAPDTDGNTTVTPIPEQNKDDHIYMSDGHMLGANGVKVPSKTIWKGEGKERIDVENPNLGKRPGQVHYQDNKNNKYYYDPNNNNFYSFDSSKNKVPAPSSVNNLLEEPKFKQAIDKGMKQYLGEK